jgi:hypothetical protein
MNQKNVKTAILRHADFRAPSLNVDFAIIGRHGKRVGGGASAQMYCVPRRRPTRASDVLYGTKAALEGPTLLHCSVDGLPHSARPGSNALPIGAN